MKRWQIMKIIRDLATSQGFYTRLYCDLIDMKVNDPERYEETMTFLEAQNFQSALDLILCIEG